MDDKSKSTANTFGMNIQQGAVGEKWFPHAWICQKVVGMLNIYAPDKGEPLDIVYCNYIICDYYLKLSWAMVDNSTWYYAGSSNERKPCG